MRRHGAGIGGVMSEITRAQQNSLHLWLRRVADCLNDAGFSVMQVMRHDAEIPWTEASVKELLWRPVQRVMVNHESTTDCDKLDYPAIEEVIARHIAQSIGVTLPAWPSEQTKAEEAA